jgi:glycerophosphoryl diester phosphodiesterase
MSPPRPAPRAPGRPLVLGHRGASTDAPENTLKAFQLALQHGADGIELDVWRCGSGEVVVFHDEETTRVAGARLRVTEATWSELSVLDAGGQWGERFRGERIPLLAEVLDAFPDAVVNVELKSAGVPDLRLAAAVARVLTGCRAPERVLVSSFNYALLGAFRLAAPKFATGLLFDAGQAWRIRAALGRLIRPAALHPDRTLVTEERARRWSRRGYAVNVWTVDAEDEVARLCALGAAAIISNVPSRAREAVRRATGL